MFGVEARMCGFPVAWTTYCFRLRVWMECVGSSGAIEKACLREEEGPQ